MCQVRFWIIEGVSRPYVARIAMHRNHRRVTDQSFLSRLFQRAFGSRGRVQENEAQGKLFSYVIANQEMMGESSSDDVRI